jgi:CDGSH-type Zn-finger protein/ferredoxin
MSEENNQPIIDMREDGPFLAKHLPELRDRAGNALEPRPLAPLCRCGGSSNKPYCDGTHREIDFKSPPKAAAEKNKVKTYSGDTVDVHYNPLLCCHAAECVRRARGVFDPKQRPWIDPDRGDDTDAIRDAVRACPSGALRISEPGEKPHHLDKTEQMAVEVEPNGPLWVANVPLAVEFWPEGSTQQKYVLCRCGKTGNAPFCDGTHSDIGWKDGS